MGRKKGVPNKNRESLYDRFFSMVVEKSNGCWETKGKATNPGITLDNGKKKNARHVAWYLEYGEFANGVLEVSCKNYKCVNPEHLICMSSWKDRFWSFVDKKSDEECWNWVGHRDSSGYGIFRHPYSTKAHRVSWYLHYGEIKNNLLVCHKCDNTSCVNPNHLFLGTILDNNLDKVSKGRHKGARGERNFGAILSKEQVDVIRFLYSTNKYSTYKLASVFQVSRNCISRIVNEKTWRY